MGTKCYDGKEKKKKKKSHESPLKFRWHSICRDSCWYRIGRGDKCWEEIDLNLKSGCRCAPTGFLRERQKKLRPDWWVDDWLKLESSSLGKHTAHFVLQKKTFGDCDIIKNQKKKTNRHWFVCTYCWMGAQCEWRWDIKYFNKHFFDFISTSSHVCVWCLKVMFILVLPIKIFNPIQFIMDTCLEWITLLYLLAAQLCTGVFLLLYRLAPPRNYRHFCWGCCPHSF